MPSDNSREITVVGYDPRYRDDFAKLNEAWIEHYFTLEEIDRERVVGTCALIAHAEGVFELAKMAVLESELGRGLGHIIMKETISRARQRGAHKIMLLSNTAMEPAIHLYEKFGFVVTRRGPHPDYDRADIEMELDLNAS